MKLVCSLLVAAMSLADQTPPDPAVRTVSATSDQMLAAAQRAFTEGKLDQADILLAALSKSEDPAFDRNKAVFLKGLVLARRGEHDKAVTAFRLLLVDGADLPLVQYELGRSLFALRRDKEAKQAFRRAARAPLPDKIKATIAQHLQDIEDRRVIRTAFTASVVPNSNLNAGAGDDLGTFFLNGWIPFAVSDAPAQSGTGLATSGWVSARQQLAPDWFFESRIGGRYTDYDQTGFDDVMLYAEAGPTWRADNAQLRLSGIAQRRDVGGNAFSETFGARLELTSSLAARTRFSFNGGLGTNRYPATPARNGPYYTFGSVISHRFSRYGQLHLAGQFTREQPDSSPNSVFEKNVQYQLSFTAQHELPGGFVGFVTPAVYLRRYDACNPIDFSLEVCSAEDLDFVDGEQQFRKDIAPSLTVGAFRPRWQVLGFTPSLSYTYTANDSNVARYSYDRHTVDFSFRRVQ